MLLLISTTHKPATDLGYLLHKNPGRLHSDDLGFGHGHIFYPEATEEKCTAAMMLDIDPVALVRGRSGPKGEGGRFDQYVNDRPYVASSFMSTAMGRMLGTAMGGRSKERQELADAAIPLEIRLPTLPCRGGEPFLRRLFEPLGYEVEAQKQPLNERFPEWGESPYFDLTLKGTKRLADMLCHLYVLIPVLDDDKHYWVDTAEIDKLLRRGKDWLEGHPEKKEIVRRYLRRQNNLTREALARLTEIDADPDPDAREAKAGEIEEAVEKPMSLHEQRLNSVLAVLKGEGAKRVVDLGCGEGRLLELLLKDRFFQEVVGMDVSLHVLQRAESKLKLDRLPPSVAARLKLIHGSLVYRDARIEGYDAAACVEVIEHLDPHRLASFERIVFEHARFSTVVITTPNSEYNVLFETLREGRYRHRDHRFEWTRAELQEWGNAVADRHGYAVRYLPIGPEDATHGAPSQMAVFTRS